MTKIELTAALETVRHAVLQHALRVKREPPDCLIVHCSAIRLVVSNETMPVNSRVETESALVMADQLLGIAEATQ